jgi:hypothetical protein
LEERAAGRASGVWRMRAKDQVDVICIAGAQIVVEYKCRRQTASENKFNRADASGGGDKTNGRKVIVGPSISLALDMYVCDFEEYDFLEGNLNSPS